MDSVDTRGDRITDKVRDMFFVYRLPIIEIQEYLSQFLNVDKNMTMLIVNGFKRVVGNEELSILEECWE